MDTKVVINKTIFMPAQCLSEDASGEEDAPTLPATAAGAFQMMSLVEEHLPESCAAQRKWKYGEAGILP